MTLALGIERFLVTEKFVLTRWDLLHELVK